MWEKSWVKNVVLVVKFVFFDKIFLEIDVFYFVLVNLDVRGVGMEYMVFFIGKFFYFGYVFNVVKRIVDLKLVKIRDVMIVIIENCKFIYNL